MTWAMMIIIACGAGLGTGCTMDKDVVLSTTCRTVQQQIVAPVNTAVAVTCVELSVKQ